MMQDESHLFNQLSRWLYKSHGDRTTRHVSELGVTIATDRGIVREENQDRVGLIRFTKSIGESNSFLAIALADGMGGLVDGGQCAEESLSTFFTALVDNSQLRFPLRIEVACHAANSGVFEKWNGKGGSTLSAVIADDTGQVYSLNVGDSRIYSSKNSDQEAISRESIDDNLEEAFGGSGRGLLQFIGIGRGMKAHIKNLENKGTIILTSDGVHSLPQELFREIYARSPDQKTAAERLIALARWMGGYDNASIAIMKLPVPIFGSVQATPTLEFLSFENTTNVVFPRIEHRPKRSARVTERQDRRKTARVEKLRESQTQSKPDQLTIDVEIGESKSDGSNR